jgi:hypothetical protein
MADSECESLLLKRELLAQPGVSFYSLAEICDTLWGHVSWCGLTSRPSDAALYVRV